MSRRQFPTIGTAGGLHHERESFRSGWRKARELLDSRVYHGDMPEADMVLLARWYAIRSALLSGDDKKKFELERNEFDQTIPKDASDQLFNAIRLITGYLSTNNKH